MDTNTLEMAKCHLYVLKGLIEQWWKQYLGAEDPTGDLSLKWWTRKVKPQVVKTYGVLEELCGVEEEIMENEEKLKRARHEMLALMVMMRSWIKKSDPRVLDLEGLKWEAPLLERQMTRAYQSLLDFHGESDFLKLTIDSRVVN